MKARCIITVIIDSALQSIEQSHTERQHIWSDAPKERKREREEERATESESQERAGSESRRDAPSASRSIPRLNGSNRRM